MVTKNTKLQSSLAKEALSTAISYAMCDSMRRGPGQIIMRMSKEDREALSHLTSEDTMGMRSPYAIDVRTRRRVEPVDSSKKKG